MSVFIQLIYSYFHVTILPSMVWLHFLHTNTHNSQFLHSLWKRAKTQNVSFETLYGGQLMLSTRLIILNYPVILSHWRSTRVSLETISLNFIFRLHGWQLDLVAWIRNGFWHCILAEERMVRLYLRNWAGTFDWIPWMAPWSQGFP